MSSPRPGGLFIFHTPNARGYQIRLGRALPQGVKNLLVRWIEGRDEEDVYPAYYRANDEATIGRVAEEAGLEVEEVRLLVTHAEFATFLLVTIVELLWLRALNWRLLRPFRPNIVGILARPSAEEEADEMPPRFMREEGAPRCRNVAHVVSPARGRLRA